MNDLEALSAELEALKQRVTILEAERVNRMARMTYNWHRDDYRQPVYEHCIDPAMRMTRNGS